MFSSSNHQNKQQGEQSERLQQNKMMEPSLLLEKKNRQNITKLNSIINEYESKLDNRVNQVISEMLNYTKKCSDPILQPVVHHKKPNPSSAAKQTHKERNKSLSFNTNISFQTDPGFDAEMEQLRETYKNLESTKVMIDEGGRSTGKQTFIRPKFVKKKPQIMPKEARLNPFHERNAIKAYELDKGLLSLLQKGKIGKDVNIITAFQKGRPVLQAQKAIFHQGEERFAELENDKNELANRQKKQQQQKQQTIEFRQKNFEDNWALTMPKQEEKSGTKNLLLRTQQKSRIQLTFKQRIYLKILNYETCNDQNFKLFLLKNLHYKGEILQILQQLTKMLFTYSVDIAYADSCKVLEYATKVSKMKKSQLIDCLVNKTGTLISLINVRSMQRKKELAMDRVTSCFRFYLERRQFLKFLKKKKIANRIYGWGVSCWTVKKRIAQVAEKRKEIDARHNELQLGLAERYTKLQEEKHFQIHIINESIQGKEAYRECLNIQLTRIFNLRNANKYLIYMLPFPIDEETVNYYYKIMELQEIPNYKDRVSFIEVDPQINFTAKINTSTKLYYNSKVIRRLKKKIKDFASYFVISYPTLVDVKLSAYFNIPILGGSLIKLLELQKRSNLQQFKFQTIQRHIFDHEHGPHNLTALSDDLIAYCENLKRRRQFIIKINGRHRSKGSALLSFPFASLPEMYSSTNVISQGLTVDEFYRLLLKEGGVVEVYEDEIYPVVGIINIAVTGEINLIGSFEKLSSGFINIGYTFPQRKIDNKWLFQGCKKIGTKLYQEGHYGDAEVTFYIDGNKSMYLQKVQCYLTHLGSSLFYYKFLSQGEFTINGDYMAKIIDTFEKEGGVEEEVVTMEPRSFCFIPYLLHFGLSDRQINSFFQLCRMGGVSFDLENKYGATFILLGSLKTSMGLITTAKDRKGAVKLMLKSLEFILKQNSHNMSNQTLAQKQVRMKQRENIINIKERLQDM